MSNRTRLDTIIHDFGYYTPRQLADLLEVDYQRGRYYKITGRVTWLVSGRWECTWCGNQDRRYVFTYTDSTMIQRSTCRRCFSAYKHHLPWDTYLGLLAGGCGVCGRRDKIRIDHDHSCCPGGRSCGKCIRGLLCDFHNMLAGCVESGEAGRVTEWLSGRPAV